MSPTQFPHISPKVLMLLQSAVKFRMSAFEKDYAERTDVDDWSSEPFNWDDYELLKIGLDYLDEIRRMEERARTE